MNALDILILELLERGYKLPEKLHSSKLGGDEHAEWLLMDYHPMGGFGQVITYADAHNLIAMELLRQVQGWRPELKTNSHGDWYLKLADTVPSPATHWDIPVHETIIRGVHASNLEPRATMYKDCEHWSGKRVCIKNGKYVQKGTVWVVYEGNGGWWVVVDWMDSKGNERRTTKREGSVYPRGHFEDN